MNAEILKAKLEEVRLTSTVDDDFFEQLHQFERIILRGAGNFGSEIGLKLLEFGIPKEKLLFWDIRADELPERHGIKVTKPFISSEPSDAILIIHCIPNGSLSGSTILTEMHQHGYSNILDGMALFESAFCLMRSDTGYDAKNCLNTEVCNWTNCDRLLAFSERDCGNPKKTDTDDLLSFQVMDVFVSSKCTLGCKDCGAYMNVYAEQESAKHISFEQIKHDVDVFFDAIDTVGFLSIIGGEPFLHPKFSLIISHLLEKPNFAVMGITTSGICKISNEDLKVLKNDRTRVIFSDYTHGLTDKQKRLFAENIQKVKEFGIHYTVGEPVWATTPSLKHHDCSTSELKSMKDNCTSTKTCQALLNGRLYPCSTTLAVHELNVDEYDTDYISLDSPNLREAIKELHNQESYGSCSRCTDGGAAVSRSGVQARDSRFDHVLEGISIAIE